MSGTEPPTHYEIRVEGVLHPCWSSWFSGLRVSSDASGETTTIAGPVTDQAALHGLLSKVRDLGLPLIAVRRVPPECHDTEAAMQQRWISKARPVRPAPTLLSARGGPMEQNSPADRTGAAIPSGRGYREHRVPRGQHQLYARDYPGVEPALVLLHGFPDNLHLYDQLVPYLNPPRRVITFDFLGWGASDKPTGYSYTATNQLGDLDAVIEHLQLGPVVLVAHDASGPPAINWALEHPQRVAALVLLNTYYCNMPGLRPPEAIWLFSTPVVRQVTRPVSRLFGDLVFRRMYSWQVGRFFRDPEVRREFVPLLYEQFVASPTTHEAFFGLNQDLPATIAAGTAAIPRLQRFDRPVRIIFGAADPYLNPRVARRFHELLPTSELFLLPGARHYVQMDEPAEVARLLLALPTEPEGVR